MTFEDRIRTWQDDLVALGEAIPERHPGETDLHYFQRLESARFNAVTDQINRTAEAIRQIGRR